MVQNATNDQQASTPACFEIQIMETVDPRWAACLDGVAITVSDRGETILRISGMDRAALHGVLAWIGEHNLTLVSVVPCVKTDS